MSAPLDVPGGATQAPPEAVLAGGGVSIEGRSLGQIAWMRLKRDRWALTGGVVVVILILIAVLAPLVVKVPRSGPPRCRSRRPGSRCSRTSPAPASASCTTS